MKNIKLKKKMGWIMATLILLFSWFSFSPDLFGVSRELEVFTSVFWQINTQYVDNTKPGDLMKKAIDAMLTSLDPYTNLIPESEIEDYRFMTTGQYGGVGALVRKRQDYVVISEPYEGFPAQMAGLKAGDIIMQVDGKSVKGKGTDEVSKVLKGQPGTVVKLIVSRDGDTSKVFSITRQEIKVKSVPYSGFVKDSVGYILLTSFTEDCSKEIKKAFEELNSSGKLKALILDLRGNPGGLLYEAVNISNFFLEKGELIVKTRGRVQEWEKSYKGLNAPLSTSIPIAVLVNSGSASASEIVAGAIQDFDRGVIIGQRTFGKGLVQTTRNLSYNNKLKVTTAKYYTPSGRCIQALDYSNRNPDGSVGKVPDSLTRAFTTKSGRLVYDGGGIQPDISTAEKPPSSVALALERNFKIFDFATNYCSKNPPPSDVKSISVPENQFNEFIAEVSTGKIDFDIVPDKALSQLKRSAEKDGYKEELGDDFIAISGAIESAKKMSVIKNSTELKKRVEAEIASRYFFQKGRIECNLRADAEVDSALNVLSNARRYKSILSASRSPK